MPRSHPAGGEDTRPVKEADPRPVMGVAIHPVMGAGTHPDMEADTRMVMGADTPTRREAILIGTFASIGEVQAGTGPGGGLMAIIIPTPRRILLPSNLRFMFSRSPRNLPIGITARILKAITRMSKTAREGG